MSNYDRVISHVFHENHVDGDMRVSFRREELADACNFLNISRIRNLGDIPYTYRFRRELPSDIASTAQTGYEWIITGVGVGCYEFRLASPAKLSAGSNRLRVKIPDATPEIVKKYAPGTDEQALLTKVRYNRIIDIFTGLTCYSIQNHLRTTVSSLGQIEIDEIYLGVNKQGVHYVLPCQAKSPGDMFGIVQVMQDIAFCKDRYPMAICKPIALQFLSEYDLAVLELSVSEENEIYSMSIVDERHYKLSGRDDITNADLSSYSSYAVEP
jgi:hypothetical protein